MFIGANGKQGLERRVVAFEGGGEGCEQSELVFSWKGDNKVSFIYREGVVVKMSVKRSVDLRNRGVMV